MQYLNLFPSFRSQMLLITQSRRYVMMHVKQTNFVPCHSRFLNPIEQNCMYTFYILITREIWFSVLLSFRFAVYFSSFFFNRVAPQSLQLYLQPFFFQVVVLNLFHRLINYCISLNCICRKKLFSCQNV